MHDTPLKKQVSIVHYSNTTRRCKFTLQSIIVFIESAPLFIFGSNAFHDFAHDRCNEGKQVFGFAHDSTTREASVAKIPGFRNTPSFEKNPVRNETKGSAKKWSKGPGLNTSLKQNRAFSKWGWKVGNYNGAIMSGCWHDTKNNLLGLMPSIKIQFLDSWRTPPSSPSWLFVQRARFGSNTMAEFPINTSMQFEPKKLRFEMHRNLIGSAEKRFSYLGQRETVVMFLQNDFKK